MSQLFPPPPIVDITPFSLLDFPDLISCILWFWGCNFRCQYCHNPELVIGTCNVLQQSDIERFLISRQGLLDGVVLSGGECTMYDNLPELLCYIKSLGFKVKIDTNGTNPQMLDDILYRHLVDYIALDYKAPAKKYRTITQNADFDKVSESLGVLCKFLDCATIEVRTTVHTDLLDADDVNEIINDLLTRGFTGIYCIQQYQHRPTLGKMQKMQRKFDKIKVNDSKQFRIIFRNCD